MFQPLNPFDLRDIDFLRTLKRRFIVIQTYETPSGSLNNNDKLFLMLTDYDAQAQARAHRNSISNDKRSVIFDLENDSHREKLREMLQPGSKYVIYHAAVPNGSNSHLPRELA